MGREKSRCLSATTASLGPGRSRRHKDNSLVLPPLAASVMLPQGQILGGELAVIAEGDLHLHPAIRGRAMTRSIEIPA